MIKKKVGLILTGGYIEQNLLKECMETYEILWVIAVDKGLNTAYELSLPVDVIIGDFDSVDKSILDHYEKGRYGSVPKVVALNPEKDMTDTQVAIEYGMSLQKESIEEMIILGATGTRLDHVLANIGLLMIPLSSHLKTCILDRNNRIYLKKESFSIKREESHGKYVSLLPLTEEVTGLTLKGFKYPLYRHTLKQGNSLGVSNEIIEEEAFVTLTSGILIVIESRD